MPFLFSTLLDDAGLDPKNVKLLRHKPRGIADPFPIWRHDRARFEAYQSIQTQKKRAHFRAPVWAAFATVPGSKTIFLGLYAAQFMGPVHADEIDPMDGGMLDPERHDRYNTSPIDALSEYAGRLFVEWGEGARSWVQNGTTEKRVVELYDRYREAEFPGFLHVVQPLSQIASLPERWVDQLRSARGIYLLTCPATKEVYVGKADGADGFWGRWLQYAATGHGGNVRLRDRQRSDYQVSVLEVAGSAASSADIDAMEVLWKRKLQSREMGLNAN